MTSANSRLLLLGALLVGSGGALVVFTITIGQGRLTGPGVFLAGSVGTLGVVAYLLVRTAQALVETGALAEAREEKAATGRRRKELEREYNTLKRAIKELELDYSMGKISEQDYSEIRTRYRERAVRVLRQLDQGESYRAQIDRDLQVRLKAKGITKKPDAGEKSASAAAPVAAEATAVTKVPAEEAAATAETGAAKKEPAKAAADEAAKSAHVLPPGYEPSIISEEPTKAADAFAALTGGRSGTPALAPGYEPSIISEEPTKAASKLSDPREGLQFNDSATVMRAVAKLTGGNTVSNELTQQNEVTQQTSVPSLAMQSPSQPGKPVPKAGPAACAACSTANDADANFCKKCGTRLHA